MATAYPTAIDTPVNPAVSDKLNNPSHAAQHVLENTAITAIETKLGTGASTPSSGTVLRGTGVGASAFGAIVNADVDAAAAIVYSKLSLTGGIVNADLNASAAIAYSKLNLTGGIVNADVNASAAIAYSKLNLANSITSADIVAGTIVNSDINASAAIDFSKLAAAAWTASTPTWTGLTIGNGSTGGYYQSIGKWVIYKGFLSCGTTTNTTGIGTPIYCTLPTNALATGNFIDMGMARISDNSGGISSNCSSLVLAANRLYFYASPDVTQAVAGGYPTGYLTSGAGNSTGDTITWTLVYEAA